MTVGELLLKIKNSLSEAMGYAKQLKPDRDFRPEFIVGAIQRAQHAHATELKFLIKQTKDDGHG